MKHIIARSTAQPEKVGPFDIVRALPNHSVQTVGPVIFLDHMPEKEFAPNALPALDGSFAHPHRGIATFTYLIKGELAHLDSQSGRGIIQEGGVQWMNAGNGIIHDEGFPDNFRARRGSFYGFQFWVNLPSKNKAARPDYMPVQAKDLPVIELPAGAGTLKVLLGEYKDQRSPIPAFTEQFIWHIHLISDQVVEVPTKSGFEYGGYLPTATARISGEEVSRREFFLFENNSDAISLQSPSGQSMDILLFGGEPYLESIVSHGPFVMNTPEEITLAYSDFRSGKYGKINYKAL
ncbi:pirin family protein [uncultured Microbulbifer sp.]|uniref:pirin family protein n=1 Tax=uncultured Microbulbifer sp. TaxID=348147 RepID=UPI002610CACF|nr:pirin family protein [uncultured Microbulbifer sp.]